MDKLINKLRDLTKENNKLKKENNKLTKYKIFAITKIYLKLSI